MRTILKFTAILLIVAGSFSCGDKEDVEQTSWEILLDSNSPVIESVVDGIGFKFCLLNEEGIPANKFREGENFSFHFEMTNQQISDSLCFWHGLICELTRDGFGRVINNQNDTTECLYNRVICTEDLRRIPFYGKQSHYEQTFPLNDINLYLGTYHTEFSHTFEFFVGLIGRKPSNVCTKPLTFKINFKIEQQ